MAKITLNYKSKSVYKFVTLTFFFPTDDEILMESHSNYKTMYFLSHYSGTADALESYIQFRLNSIEKDLVIVLIGGDNAFYLDRPELFSNYSEFIYEIVELSRNYFPMLSTKKEDTIIAGASMGGWGAIFNGIKYNNIFGSIAAFSPFVDPCAAAKHRVFPKELMESFFGPLDSYKNSQIDLLYLIRQANENNTLPKMYMCCGTEDAIIGKECLEFIKLLANEGISFKYDITKGEHTMMYWNEMLPIAIENCLEKRVQDVREN